MRVIPVAGKRTTIAHTQINKRGNDSWEACAVRGKEYQPSDYQIVIRKPCGMLFYDGISGSFLAGHETRFFMQAQGGNRTTYLLLLIM